MGLWGQDLGRRPHTSRPMKQQAPSDPSFPSRRGMFQVLEVEYPLTADMPVWVIFGHLCGYHAVCSVPADFGASLLGLLREGKHPYFSPDRAFALNRSPRRYHAPR